MYDVRSCVTARRAIGPEDRRCQESARKHAIIEGKTRLRYSGLRHANVSSPRA